MALSSCTTITHTSKVADIDTRVFNLTVAELEVKKEKAEATASWNWTPFSTFNLNEAKDNITAEVLKTTGCDVLVEPQFEVKRRGFLRGGTITVTGYPAIYKNFHNMTPEEAKIINSSCTVIAPGTYPGVGIAAMKNKKPTYTHINKKSRRLSHKFLNILAGPALDIDDDLNAGFNLSLMYGKTGVKFGSYVKATIFDLYDSYEDEAHYGFSLTGGIVKPFSNRFSIFAGLGIGMRPTIDYDYYNYKYDIKNDFSIPVEVGAQYTFGKLNVALGFTYSTPVSGNGNGVGSPFIGVGYAF